MVNTVRFSRNLFVVGEDEYNNICAAVSGNHPIDIIIYGIQSRLQDAYFAALSLRQSTTACASLS